ncbi:serine carboxypeptidase-like 40 [Mercurialis annua]|uniref:serine carboxypeptidase-like 40 n=1 Tax=Mercurialis annua TaxID=3986 RepID=UPI00215E20BB|nr:serine carboxypeptidase-like 40 [Mercurialis annua]
MKNNPNSVIILFVIIISCLINGIHSKRQGDLLHKLAKAKFNGDPKIDTRPYSYEAHDILPVQISDLVNDTQTLRGLNTGSKEADKIVKLPGQPVVKFDQYGGYVTVDQAAGRALYYYLAEAPYGKEKLPLLLWLNGGPGCSSMAYGAMEELGPFRVNSDGKTLYINKHAWNNVANVLFLESPAGVGYSYSNRSSDYSNSGDRMTATDNYQFLVNWLERFPEYKTRDFYIAGESYAGHYIPELAHNILLHNKQAGKSIVNLKGIAIGNAAINDETDNYGQYEFFSSHALNPPKILADIKKFCNFSPIDTSKPSQQCNETISKSDNNTIGIDVYNIYAPLCHNQNLTATPKSVSFTEYDPCSDNYVYAYMNRADVQLALHANVTRLNFTWNLCSDPIFNGWKDSPVSTLPLLQEFISSGIRVWIYSGDTDGRIPVTSTQLSLKKMNLTTTTPWYPWALDKEVGGYTEIYEGLTFATVRGAGHDVPSFQPRRAVALIQNFMSGKKLPLFIAE